MLNLILKNGNDGVMLCSEMKNSVQPITVMVTILSSTTKSQSYLRMDNFLILIFDKISWNTLTISHEIFWIHARPSTRRCIWYFLFHYKARCELISKQETNKSVEIIRMGLECRGLRQLGGYFWLSRVTANVMEGRGILGCLYDWGGPAGFLIRVMK